MPFKQTNNRLLYISIFTPSPEPATYLSYFRLMTSPRAILLYDIFGRSSDILFLASTSLPLDAALPSLTLLCSTHIPVEIYPLAADSLASAIAR